MSVSKWRYTEECNGRPCPGDCDHCSFEPADLISRADAIEAVWRAITSDELVQGSVEEEILKLPSADANPTVVRCKTMIPYGDFREWAKRIREDNPNVIVIPFDAEVASADAVQGEWHKVGIKNDMWTCSVCGSPLMTDDIEETNYCPNCGARMKGGDDE